MGTQPPLFEYSKREETLNIYTHGLGFGGSVIALFLFILKKPSVSYTYFWSTIVFGVSMCVLYLASTTYHRSLDPIKRGRLKIFDHAAIYVLIAGTYTPFTLVTLPDTIGISLFIIAWSIAVVGIFLKLFFTGRFDLVSTLLYVAMGWLIIFAYNPLLESLAPEGVSWLFVGGIAYTIGAVLYSIKRIPYNHAIFHVFVLAGTFCHFWVVYFYV